MFTDSYNQMLDRIRGLARKLPVDEIATINARQQSFKSPKADEITPLVSPNVSLVGHNDLSALEESIQIFYEYFKFKDVGLIPPLVVTPSKDNVEMYNARILKPIMSKGGLIRVAGYSTIGESNMNGLEGIIKSLIKPLNLPVEFPNTYMILKEVIPINTNVYQFWQTVVI